MRFGSLAFFISVFLTMGAAPSFGQQPGTQQQDSHKYRVIGTVAGAGGGFALGVFAGIGMFDDAINSDRKVWTTALLSAAGGAAGGYLIGRAFDRRGNTRRTPPVVTPWRPDELDISLMRARSELFRRQTEQPFPRTGSARSAGYCFGSGRTQPFVPGGIGTSGELTER